VTAHRDGEGDWRMRPARPSEGGVGYIVFRVVWRAEPDCWMCDLSTQEEHADWRSARDAILAKQKEGA
jgi:hypothetical protein